MTTIVAPYGPWEPAQPSEAAAIFSVMPCPWWIAGGYAIELAAGRPIRAHDDIDVLVLRPDHLHIQRALPGWEWWAADPPGTLRPWRPGEQLPAGIHDIWCRPGPDQPWRIQVMIDESDGGDWTSRRDPSIRRPIADIGRTNSNGIPYLAPEIQLFYKARGHRPKDETDFTAILPCLTGPQRQWLSDALAPVPSASTHGGTGSPRPLPRVPDRPRSAPVTPGRAPMAGPALPGSPPAVINLTAPANLTMPANLSTRCLLPMPVGPHTMSLSFTII